MALARKVNKEGYDKLTDVQKALYIKVGENYHLDLEGDDEGVTAAKNETAAEKAKRIALEEQIATLTGDKTKAEEAAMKAAGDLEGLENIWKARMASAVEGEKANTSKYVGMLEAQTLDSLAATMAGKLSTKAGKLLQPLIRARLGLDMTGDAPVVVVKGADGKASAMTQQQLHEEFFNNADYAAIIDGSKATGGQQQQQQQQQTQQLPNNSGKPINYGEIPPGELVALIDANKQ